MQDQEAQIAEKLRANIPTPSEHTPAAITEPELTGFGNASIDLDEMTQYKLHDLFDEKYIPSNDENKQRLQYIYNNLAADLEDKDYVFVAAKIRDMLRVAGLTHSDRKIYKLYEFVRLSNIMKKTNQEMDNLRG